MRFSTYFLSICFGLFTFQISAQFSSIQHSITNSYDFVEISDDESLVVIGGIKQAKSLDGGLTFTTLNLGNFELPFSLYVYKDAAIVDQNEFCLIGKDETNHKSVLIKTYDGGSSWTEVMSTANGSYDYYNDIEYGNGVMMISFDDGVYRSTDDGDTWTFVSFTTTDIDELAYNTNTNEWIAKRYSFNYFTSSDNGLSWINHSQSFPQSGSVTMIGTHDNSFLINISLISGGSQGDGTMFLVNSNMDIQASIAYNDDITDSDPIQDIYFLPDSNIIASGIGHFFYIDSSESHVYDFNHNLIDGNGSPVQTTDFEFGNTFGIAVGMYGGISRYDASLPNDLSITPAFTFTSNACPGDTIQASPYATYADSSVWYYNGNYVSTDTLLIYETPYLFGSNELVLNNWYNGSYTADTMAVYFNSLQPAPIYSLNHVDSLPCYGDQAVVQIGYSSGWTNNGSSVNAWLGDSLIYSQSPAPSGSWTNFLTPEIYQDDSVYIVSSYQQNCGLTVDSLVGFIHVGDQLWDNFTYLPGPDTLCELSELNFYISNTVSWNSFSISSGNVNWSEEGDFYQGGSDTTMIDGPDPIMMNQKYKVEGYQITVVDTNNCSLTLDLDTITFTSPRVDFSRISDSYYLGDTVRLVNDKPNLPEWSISPQNLNITNIYDSVPFIYGQNEGIYEVTVKNEPIQGCTDSLTKSFFYGDSLGLMNTDSCWSRGHDLRDNIFQIKSDNQGNIYELSTAKITIPWNYNINGFSLLKRDSNGDVLWEVRPDSLEVPFGYGFDGILIEDFDIDSNGDLICGLWLQSSTFVDYGPISWNAPFSEYCNNYLVKIDGQTGEIIWHKDLNYLKDQFQNNWKITDIHLKEGYIYYSLSDSWRTSLFKSDHLGNVLFSDVIGILSTTSYFVYCNHYMAYGGPNSWDNLKILELSSGELAVVAYYGGHLINSGNSLSELSSLYSDGSPKPAIMVAKFDDSLGFHDFKKLASIGGFKARSNSRMGQIQADVDANDNITFSFGWLGQEPVSGAIEVMDSLLVTNDGSCVFQIDKNFDRNWIKSFSHSFVNSLSVASETGAVFIGGKTNGNLAFSDGLNVQLIGEPDYVSATSSQYNLPDIYFAKLDSNGSVIGGKVFDVSYPDPSLFANPLLWDGAIPRIYASPCEEVYTVINQAKVNQDSLLISSGQDLMFLNGSITSEITNNCGVQCIAFDSGIDTIYHCSEDSEVTLPFGSAYGVDSIGYEYWSNGVLINTDTVVFINNSIEIPIQQNGVNDSVYITHPNNKIFYLQSQLSSPVVYSYDSIQCKDESSYVNFNNTSVEYSVDGLAFQDIDSTVLSTSEVGSFDLFISSINSNQCVTYDTISYEVFVPLADTIDHLTDLTCNDTLTYLIDSVTTQSDHWYLDGIDYENEFHSGNLSSGLHEVDVSIIDTNGCMYEDLILISFTGPLNPNFDSVYLVDCNQTETIQYSSQLFSSESFSVNGLVTQNSFGPANLNPGDNVVHVELVDIEGCIFVDSFIIRYCTVNIDTYFESAQRINVYPNPVKDYLHIDISGFETDEVDIQVLDNVGRIVRDEKVQEKIFVGDLARGSYTLKLVASGKNIFEGFIIISK